MVPDSDKKKLVILRLGSHGLALLGIVEKINRKLNRHEVLGFLNDDKNKHQKKARGVAVAGIKKCNLWLLSSKMSTFGLLRVIQEQVKANIAKTRRPKECFVEGLEKR